MHHVGHIYNDIFLINFQPRFHCDLSYIQYVSHTQKEYTPVFDREHSSVDFKWNNFCSPH